MDGDKPICYYRESILQYTRHKPRVNNELEPEEGPY